MEDIQTESIHQGAPAACSILYGLQLIQEKSSIIRLCRIVKEIFQEMILSGVSKVWVPFQILLNLKVIERKSRFLDATMESKG